MEPAECERYATKRLPLAADTFIWGYGHQAYPR